MDNPTVNIEGKEYPYLMGRGAIRLYCRKKGVADIGMQDVSEVLKNQSTDDNDLLNYFCLKAGSSQKGEKFPYTFEEFVEVVNENPHLVDVMDQVAIEQSPSTEHLPGNGDDSGNVKPVKKN